jgi:hypothetical protein
MLKARTGLALAAVAGRRNGRRRGGSRSTAWRVRPAQRSLGPASGSRHPSGFDDHWNLPWALNNLVIALEHESSSEQARAHREQVLQLPATFDGPAARSPPRKVTGAIAAH